jgi:lipopolysaccharide biosynthesis regulator YciM
MSAYAPLLAGLVALLIGLTVGKAWERYKLKDGGWIDRRRTRESPHYILGLNFLVANQIDLAIEELSRAASLDSRGLEVHMILGNLYREKGQVGKAITVHQSLLQRPKLSKLEHAHVLLCLGLDYKRGGFVERALEAFNEVLRLDPNNEYALLNLQKLHEEQHQWTEAYDTRQRLTQLAAPTGRGPQNEAILAFLENEIGLEAMRRKNYAEAIRRFEAAIDLDARAVPAYLNLGDVRVLQGDERAAAAIWEQLIEVAPDRAYLAFDRLEGLAMRTGNPERFTRLCRRLIDETPHDWRARLALSRHLAAGGQPREALDLLFAALVQNPHALSIHQAIWRALGELHHPAALVDRYGELTQHAIFYLDPHVCMRCRYRSTELLWQCPHCHDWNTFVEERIAPAQDSTEVEV